MAVVGIGEILVVPSMAGFQKEVGKEVAGAGDSAPVKKAGGRIGKVLKGAAVAGLAGGAVALGTALTKGFGRLQSIETAKAKLVGLGNSAQDVEVIMGNANAAVKGTAFGLDAAATTAAGAVAAGIKPGKELEAMLSSVANSAAAAGVPMEEMGSIFNKVATSNKAQMDVINQVNDKGIPLTATLAEQLGVTAAEAEKMASAGQIGFEEFEKAMTTASGKVAEEMGNTLPGAFDNSLAAVGRFGANLLSDVYPQLTEFFKGFQEWMKPVEDLGLVIGKQLGDALKNTTEFITGTLMPAIQGIPKWLEENRTAITVTASVIGALMLPMLINWGVQATIAAAKNVAAFVLARVEAIKSAAVFVAQSYRMIGGWIAMSASAIANGIKIAAVWTAQIVKSAVVGTVKFLVQVGRTVAGWALMGVQSLLHAAKMAAAWVVAMGPIGWAIAAIVGIAAIVIANWDKIKKFTIDTWNAVSGKIKDVWNNNIRPIFQAIGGFLDRTLGPAFRWFKDKVIDPVWNGIRTVIKGVWENGIKPIFTIIQQVLKGDLTGAFQTAKDAIDRIWKGVANVVRKPINFVIGTVYNDGIRSVFNKVAGIVGIKQLDAAKTIPAFAKGGQMGRGWKLVGEEGPELINTGPGYVYTANETKRMLAGQSQMPLDALDQVNPVQAHEGIGGFWSSAWDGIKSVARGVGDAVKKGLDWVRGGLAKAAEWVLKPVMDGLSSNLGTTGFGGMASGLAKKAIDGAISWLRGKDSEAVDDGGALFVDGALGRFAKPANGHITSGFGASRGRFPHMGIDFAVAIGSAVRSMLNGVVRKIGWNAASGRTGKGMIVDHPNGYSSYYGHLNAWGKKPGDQVKAGERIADSGNTGRSTGPHLHAELWKNGKPFNYRSYLYDNGGVLPTGLSQIVNASGKPEAILSNSQWKAMSQLAERGAQAQYPASMQLVVDDYEFTAYVRGVADDSQRRNVSGLQRLQRNMTGTR